MHGMPKHFIREVAKRLPEICEEAGNLILDIYHTDFNSREKEGGSPVTDADEAGEALIIEKLTSAFPSVGIIAEEQYEKGIIPSPVPEVFFLVDPLDGTKEFISRRGEFTVNIGLVVDRAPLIGAVHLPALGITYWADEERRAWRKEKDGKPEQIFCRKPPRDGLTVVASRSHSDEATENLLNKLNVKERVSSGSSLKLCRVAEGCADLYPRMGRTMEWDIAAGHAVLSAAGGCVSTLDGNELKYGKDGTDNPSFIARGDGSLSDYELD